MYIAYTMQSNFKVFALFLFKHSAHICHGGKMNPIDLGGQGHDGQILK